MVSTGLEIPTSCNRAFNMQNEFSVVFLNFQREYPNKTGQASFLLTIAKRFYQMQLISTMHFFSMLKCQSCREDGIQCWPISDYCMACSFCYNQKYQ